MLRSVWSLVVVCGVWGAITVSAEDAARVLPVGETPADARIKAPRDLNDAYHPWVPPATKEAWDAQATAIRQQLLVSQGLWPLPAKTPIQPVIHSKVERDDYTIERVYFASRPGHYVTGSLFRPKNATGKLPGVLCPHGHWANGRFYTADDKAANEQIAIQAEKTDNGAHAPVQARMIQLARMGCVVFHYDMIGYADSLALDHRKNFSDPEAEQRLQNLMGLQTWNSIRALDFLLELPDVDPQRIGVTGASGGGTQTFILGALDPRVTVAFPAVMIGTAMQGGCVCENASYLRTGLNNVAFAACFAPRPMAMSGADDWTINIETKGLPELKQIYGFYGQSDLVQAKCFPQFKHNYNLVAREMMYNWFNQHLGLNQPSPVTERDFVRLSTEELTVFNTEHPQPADALRAPDLRRVLTAESRDAMAALLPRTPDRLAQYQQVVGVAAKVMLGGGLPTGEEVDTDAVTEVPGNGYMLHKTLLGRKDSGEKIPFVALVPDNASGSVVLWVDGHGKQALFTAEGTPTAAVQTLLDRKVSVVSIDAFQTGEYLKADQPYENKVNETFAGYTFGYNRPLVAERVRDILTTIAALKRHPDVQRVSLVGTGDAGLWMAYAAGLAGTSVEATALDLAGFSSAKVTSLRDPQLLPGSLKYGGVGGALTLAVPTRILLSGTENLSDEELQPLLYADWATRTSGRVQIEAKSAATERLIDFVAPAAQ